MASQQAVRGLACIRLPVSPEKSCLAALQAAKAGLDGAEQSLAATRSAEATSNATLAITEASNTAWRARQTAQAESAAEQQAMGASEAAGQSRSVRAYNAELAAAQSYNLVGSAGYAARSQLVLCQLPTYCVHACNAGPATSGDALLWSPEEKALHTMPSRLQPRGLSHAARFALPSAQVPCWTGCSLGVIVWGLARLLGRPLLTGGGVGL